MSGMRRLSVAFVLAAVMATGLGTASLEAKKGGGGGGTANSAICAYLKAVIEYPNVNPYILAWAKSLYEHFGCSS